MTIGPISQDVDDSCQSWGGSPPRIAVWPSRRPALLKRLEWTPDIPCPPVHAEQTESRLAKFPLFDKINCEIVVLLRCDKEGFQSCSLL